MLDKETDSCLGSINHSINDDIVSFFYIQTDAFHPTQTVLEAVLFQADMRLDPSISKKEKVFTAKGLIAMAGLEGKVGR